MLHWVLTHLLPCLVGGLIVIELVRRRLVRQAREGRTEGGLRVVSGGHPELSQRWRHGRMALESGEVLMRSAVVQVESVDSTYRSTRGMENFMVGADIAILRLHSKEGAVLEMAVQEEYADWALERLNPHAVR